MELPKPSGERSKQSFEQVEPAPVQPQERVVSAEEARMVAEGIRPLVAFEKSSRAAEANEAHEIKLETRHEAKDEPKSSQQPASSVGAILSQTPVLQTSQASTVASVGGSGDISATGMMQASSRMTPGLYRSAIVAGFSVALICIVLFLFSSIVL